jgi:TonB-linked SusC/RagA family outer membrane protein
MFNFNYGFKGKYFLDGTFRREGNSRFSDDNKYGNFWSVGASWNISEEDFMSSLDIVSNLKLRTSYGINGNAGIGSNRYLALMGYSSSYNDLPVIYYSGIENQDLTWEKSAPFNVGLDFGLLEDKLTGTIEYYHKTTSDMLLSIPLSRTSGFSSKTDNLGTMVNSGIEFSLTSVNWKTSDFSWTTSFNITKQNNEVTELNKDKSGEYAEIINGTKRIKVGNHIRTYYLRKWAGVDPETGDPLWYKNGVDGETTNNYSEAERADQGQSVPDIFGGLTNSLSYKGVTLDFQFNFAFGYKVYDGWANYMMSDGKFTGSYGGYSSLMDRWQKPGDVTNVPKTRYGGNKKSNESSTRFLYDGDHIRLRNITLGYNLPKNITNKLGLSGVNIYARGTNLLTFAFDKDLDFDPETGDTGIIDLTLPVMKTISFGLKINL